MFQEQSEPKKIFTEGAVENEQIMNAEAQKEVACNSRRQAENYMQKGNCGRAFAHFLVALNLYPHWKLELKETFSSCLCEWGNVLEKQGRYADMFNCYEQALEVFPQNSDILNNLGAHLYRLGKMEEAFYYFQKAVDGAPGNLQAFRNLQSIKNLLVERWHFRMLNDKCRNMAFRTAIMKRVRQGFDTVLDIGTGTGILSLFAVEGGAKNTYACDGSKTMIKIATKVFSASNVSDRIHLIHKLSHDIKIPTDIPNRVTLIVTETVDAGLVGEGILHTLLHAWATLLSPEGCVIPMGASLLVAAISCPYISSVTHTVGPPHLVAKPDGPYDSENLALIPGGFRMLTEAVLAVSVNFCDQEQLEHLLSPENRCTCSAYCLEGGSIDAAVAWFELNLDEDISLSSAPGTGSCWEQAIFPCAPPLHISTGQKISFDISFSGGQLSINISSDEERKNASAEIKTAHESRTVPKSASPISEKFHKTDLAEHQSVFYSFIAVSSEVIKALNDTLWVDTMYNLSSNSEVLNRKNILDLSPFPLLGLKVLKEQGKLHKDCLLVCGVKTVEDEMAIRSWASARGINNSCIKCVKDDDEYLGCCTYTFDLIIVQPFEINGELKEKTFTWIPTIRNLLMENGIILPHQITIECKLIHSDWLKQMSSVNDIDCTCGYDIGDFINEYQVPHHVDFFLKTIEMKTFSEDFIALQFNLSEVTDCVEAKELCVRTKASGNCNAVVYWYRMCMLNGGPEFSTLESPLMRQAAFLIEPELSVTTEDFIKVIVKYSQNVFHIEAEKFE